MFRRDRLWAQPREVAYYMLWFEFLKLSPSYNLARKMRAGELTDAEKGTLPADFATVLGVYDDLGDVQPMLFRKWWVETAIKFFGYQGDKPRVMQVSELQFDSIDQAGKAAAETSAYVDGAWTKQGAQSTVVLAIPVGLPKAHIAKQVAALVEKFPEAHRNRASNPPKYQLIRRKLNSESLFKYIMCLWLRARLPKTALWRIGARAKVSSMYSGRLDFDAKVPRHQQTDDRTALKILTSRAISRSIMISENAARGIFPSYAKHEHAVAPDWAALMEIVKNRARIDTK